MELANYSILFMCVLCFFSVFVDLFVLHKDGMLNVVVFNPLGSKIKANS